MNIIFSTLTEIFEQYGTFIIFLFCIGLLIINIYNTIYTNLRLTSIHQNIINFLENRDFLNKYQQLLSLFLIKTNCFYDVLLFKQKPEQRNKKLTLISIVLSFIPFIYYMFFDKVLYVVSFNDISLGLENKLQIILITLVSIVGFMICMKNTFFMKIMDTITNYISISIKGSKRQFISAIAAVVFLGFTFIPLFIHFVAGVVYALIFLLISYYIISIIYFIGINNVVGMIISGISIILIFIIGVKEDISFVINILIFLFIPLYSKSLLNWFSLKTINNTNKINIILFDIVVNFIISLIIMFIMVINLPIFIEFINLITSIFFISEKNISLDWHSFAITAINDPWGKGLMVTGIFIITLLPTILHLFLALLVTMLQLLFNSSLIRLLKNPTGSSFYNAAGAAWITAYIILAMTIFASIFYFFHYLSWSVGEIFLKVAEFGTAHVFISLSVSTLILIGIYWLVNDTSARIIRVNQ